MILGASAPEVAIGGREFTARFFAYRAGLQDAMMNKLGRLNPDDGVHDDYHRVQWAKGTQVTVTCTGDGLSITPEKDVFVWDGDSEIVDFDVVPDAPLVGDRTILKFDASIGGIRVMRMRIPLSLRNQSASTPRGSADAAERNRTETCKAPRTAFASYASRDRKRVIDCVRTIKINAGIDVFLDCLSLNPSEEWKARLQREIEDRDLFLLFWSKAALESQWVEWEWKLALATKSDRNMEVHPLELPEEARPPQQLEHLHFGDVLNYIREAQV